MLPRWVKLAYLHIRSNLLALEVIYYENACWQGEQMILVECAV